MQDLERPATEFATRFSARPVDRTVSELLRIVDARGMTVFAVIDQAAEAAKVGLELRPTTLVLFGNPRAGTRVMQSAPLAAVDLPLKVLVWADGEQTTITYLSPAALGARYGLNPELTASLAGIDTIVDALVAACT